MKIHVLGARAGRDFGPVAKGPGPGGIAQHCGHHERQCFHINLLDELPEERPASDHMIRLTMRVAVAGAVVVVAVLSAIALYASSMDRPSAELSATPAPANMVEVAPGGVLAPEDVPPGLAAHYQSAQDHPEIFSAVPCFCGCEEMLGHATWATASCVPTVGASKPTPSAAESASAKPNRSWR